MESNNKSGKRSALKKKSEKIDQANQTQSSRKKITGTKTMNNTIKEGHNFIDGKPAHYVDKEDEKDEEGNVGASEGTRFPGGLSTSYFMVSKFTLKKMVF